MTETKTNKTQWKSFSITDAELALLPELRKAYKCANDSHLFRELIADAKRRLDKRKDKLKAIRAAKKAGLLQ
jgi:hypothetical protein